MGSWKSEPIQPPVVAGFVSFIDNSIRIGRDTRAAFLCLLGLVGVWVFWPELWLCLGVLFRVFLTMRRDSMFRVFCLALVGWVGSWVLGLFVLLCS